MGTLGKAAWKLIKMLLNSKIRGKAVRLMDVYSLALSEMSNALGKPPPPHTCPNNFPHGVIF